jgi:hypothetical protein
MTKIKKELISIITNEILKCYDDNGNLEDEYYNNIILDILTRTELENLKELASGKL